MWKEIKPDADASIVDRFRREIEILSKLNHPRIAEVVFADLLATTPYLVMPKAKQNLEIAVKFDVTRQIDRIEIFSQICEGMMYVHDEGTLHRDLKPTNILLTEENSVIISDFGLARDLESDEARLTKLNDIGGTRPYSAPEQYDSSLKNIDQRADIFSLGMILYYLLTGQHPYIINSSLVSQPIYDLVKRATDLDRDKRFDNVRQLHDEFLKSVSKSATVDAARDNPRPRRFGEIQVEIQKLAKSARGRGFFRNVEIENIVTELQQIIWLNRDLFGDDPPDDPLGILDAPMVLRVLGFDVNRSNALGTFYERGKEFQVAGQIDQRRKIVIISNHFDPATTKFTEAHELGHAFLHLQDKLHRDRPLSHTSMVPKGSPEEYQANKFAAYFLMPKKQVLRKFREIFGVDKLEINQETADSLFRSDVSTFISRVGDQKGLARFLAGTSQVGGRQVRSLSEIFGVSIQAMAIRLEEVGIVEF